MAGYNALTNYNDWLNKQYSSAHQDDTWKTQQGSGSNDMWNDYQKLYSKYNISPSGYAASQGQQINTNTFNNLTPQQQLKKFNSYGYDLDNVKNWINAQKTNYQTDYDALIKKYTSPGGSSTDTNANTTEHGLIDTRGTTTGATATSGGTQTGNASGTPGMQTMTDTNQLLLDNPDRPSDAVLTGLMSEFKKMNQNNQTMIDNEKARADELIALLQNNNTVEKTENFKDILSGVYDPSNPLMQKAIQQANEEMSSRGLLNSSLGAQAANEAVLNRAMEIAAGELQGQQYNAGQFNTSQRALLGEMGQTGRQSMNFMGDIYRNNQAFNQELLGNRQAFAFDLMANKNKMDEEIRKLEAAHDMDMDKTKYEYAATRAGDMLTGNKELDNSFINAITQIQVSEIPDSAKTEHIARTTDLYNKAKTGQTIAQNLKITFDPATGDYKFSLPKAASVAPTTTATKSTNTQKYTYETAVKDSQALLAKVDKIYPEVRAGGGDSPQEALIDGWRKVFTWAKNNNKELYTQAMKIYADKGFNSDNWESILSAQIDLLEGPYRKAISLSGANMDDDLYNRLMAG